MIAASLFINKIKRMPAKISDFEKLNKIKKKLSIDFNLVDYTNFSKLIIYCKIHGNFTISYFNLIQNAHNCPKCGLLKKSENRKLSIETVIAQFKTVHGEKYDYSKVNYVKSSKPITIICSVHGEFSQTPKLHKLGSGCHRCYLENVNGKFMKNDKWREWASVKMKNFRTSPEYYKKIMNNHGVINPMQLDKTKKACLNTNIVRYGVLCGFLVDLSNTRQYKIKSTNINNGRWLRDDDKPKFYLYTQTVWNFTRKYLKKYSELADVLLADNGVNTYHIDHIYSIYDGYVNNVDPMLVGHIVNLQKLEASKNRKKSSNSWITLSELNNRINEFGKNEE